MVAFYHRSCRCRNLDVWAEIMQALAKDLGSSQIMRQQLALGERKTKHSGASASENGVYCILYPQVMAIEWGDDDESLPQEFHFNDPDSFDYVGDLR